MTHTIEWRGNEYTNSSARTDSAGRSYTPFVIVDHISAGTMSSMDEWFTDPTNDISSANFGVSRRGEIHQYVDIRRMAWANGATVFMYPRTVAQVVLDNYGVNPNLYTVSIEHEGHDGNLTEEQLAASVWLHGYIRDEITRIYGGGAAFPLDDYHVIGHYQISRAKPNCPGPAFPWARLYEALRKGVDEPMLDRGVAKTIIGTWMKPSWETANASGDREQCEYIRWLANELRKACGANPDEDL